MSRIGKLPISIPAGVTITLKENVVNVKGPKGELSQFVNPAIIVEVADGHVVLKENEEAMLDNLKQRHAFHGLYRALINNMVVGVSEGYKKELELVGVGYRASNNGNIIDFALGYTHNIFMQLPPEIKVETKSERNKNPLIILESCDKQLLGQVCSKIRSFRKPEPYKGKGIKFVGEEIRRKSGKSAGANNSHKNRTIMTTKIERRIKIKYRVRNKISGTAERPRMSVFRSNKQIYVQVIDDLSGKTLVAASSLGMEPMPKKEQAAKVGELIAKKAQEAGITTVVFDRNGYLYHGRVKEVADAARNGGLKFNELWQLIIELRSLTI